MAASTIKLNFTYKDYPFSGTKSSAGTIGSRYDSQDIDIRIAGYKPVAISIVNPTNTNWTHYAASILDDLSARIYLYAASTSTGSYSGTIRIVYLKK